MSNNSTIKQNNAKRPQGQMGGGMRGGGGRGLSRPAEKAKDFKGTLRKLLHFIKPELYKIAFITVIVIASTAFTILGPKFLGQATTYLAEGLTAKMNGTGSINFPAIHRILIIMMILYAMSSLLSYVQQRLMAIVGQSIVFTLRKQVNEKLNRLPISYYDTHAFGDILSRVTNDIDLISTTLQQSLTQIISAMVTLVGVLTIMISMNWQLTLVTLLTVPLSIIITVRIAKASQKFYIGQQNVLGSLNGQVEEVYAGHNIILAFGQKDESEMVFNNYNQDLYAYGWKSQFVSGIIQPLLNFVSNLGYIGVAIVGAYFSITRGMPVGYIQSFLQYSRQFSDPITTTANIANVLQSTVAAAERVFELLEEQEEPIVENPQTIEHPTGRVDFERVVFGYEPQRPIINDVTIHVKPEETVAIVGPTGAGKTTLVNLLMRFYDVDSGSIKVDGVDIKHMDRGYLRSMFGMVLQDTWLFEGTIYDNLKYANENATEEDIIEAAKIATSDHFIRTLPQGYQTMINEDASNISQGQKQLLTITRAILTNPEILILDEATSSVDTRTEALIQHAMDKLMEGRTNFVIAHRLSTIKNANNILVMDKGAIIEQGTHEELLAKKGFYYNLYNSQFNE